jgi:hypothetical protein
MSDAVSAVDNVACMDAWQDVKQALQLISTQERHITFLEHFCWK